MIQALLAFALAVQPSLSAQEDRSVPEPQTVVDMPQQLRETFHRQVLEVTKSPDQRLSKIIQFMFDQDGMGLKYRPDATNTITEAYQKKEVNCLSFTLLAIALAREAGFSAYPQQIDRVLVWGVAGDLVVQSMHANAVIVTGGRKLMFDVASNSLSSSVVDYRISDEHLLALYYSNRAMELLAEGYATDAENWMNAALSHDQSDATLWNNAGILRQRMGDELAAERYFLKAIERKPNLSSALSNLIEIYRARGDIVKLHYWQAKAIRFLRRDPYYQFSEGRRFEVAGDLLRAIDCYKRAISLRSEEHLFHSSLARSYFRLGLKRSAESELRWAWRLSNGADQKRYQSKIYALKRLFR